MDSSDRNIASPLSTSRDIRDSFLDYIDRVTPTGIQNIENMCRSSYMPSEHPLVQLFYLTEMMTNTDGVPLTEQFSRSWHVQPHPSKGCLKVGGIGSAVLFFGGVFGTSLTLATTKIQEIGMALLFSFASAAVATTAQVVHTHFITQLGQHSSAKEHTGSAMAKFYALHHMQQSFKEMGNVLSALYASSNKDLGTYVVRKLPYNEIKSKIAGATDIQTAEFILEEFNKHYFFHAVLQPPEDMLLANFLTKHCMETTNPVQTRISEVSINIDSISDSDPFESECKSFILSASSGT